MCANEDGEACRYIIELIYQRCRIRLHDGKESLIRARLGKLMRPRGIEQLADYVRFLQHQAGEEEFTKVVDALTTNHTQFLREADHFDYLVRQALPGLLRPGARRFRVWSAACSSGEEPYTLAMYLAEHFPLQESWDWQITATDISTKVLAVAQRGIYSMERAEGVSDAWLRKHFQKGYGTSQGFVRVRPELKERVQFAQLNLVKPYSHAVPFEVVFCRNVMIYFDRPTQEQLIHQLCRYLVPGGYLFTGHSEGLNGLRIPLRCLQPSIYRKD
ncbi:MAG: chemotaxis protein methyltransferase CheR [Limisphaerales bacterium]|nr:MAG: chemotaxis protein methyltransferase CheR [Limisphaerales bacterium]